MSLAKKPRISDVRQLGVVSGCHLGEEIVITLPKNIGAISAISAWSPSGALESGPGQGGLSYIAIGTDTGCAMLIDSNKKVTTLEGSGGPAIQCLLVKSATATTTAVDSAQPSSLPDTIACDSDGRVSVYAMGQMFARNVFSAPISVIALDTNPHAPSAFIVGDLSGAVTACHAQEVLWRAQVEAQEPASRAERLRPQTQDSVADPGISGVCAVQFPDSH
ncbi:hypothetical protein IWW57_006516, partial [Coemansia sp. S610]